jgi:hypothetical protein
MGLTTIESFSSPRETPQLKNRLRDVLLIGLLTSLAAFTNIKLAGLQMEDVALMGLSFYSVAKFLASGFFLQVDRTLHSLLKSWCLLLLSLLILAVLALRLKFYPLEDASLLKQPVVFSVSKLLQLAAIIVGFLWLTNRFLNKKYLIKAMDVYWYTGIGISLYAVICWIFLLATHIDVPFLDQFFGAYLLDGHIRARGFFNEGGPFGIYVASVLIIGLLRGDMTGRSISVVKFIILGSAFLLSSSKAGFFLLLLMFIGSVMLGSSTKTKLIYLLPATILFTGIAFSLNLQQSLEGYINAYQGVEDKIAYLSNDNNIVLGRVAALYIVPRMLAAHPATGIGIGNYPLMRNDPHYLGKLPTIRDREDLPALGIAGIAAELGIPATLWMMVLFLVPYWTNRKNGILIRAAASFQFLAHAMGVQITFFYPWFVSACVISMSYQKTIGYKLPDKVTS